MKWAVFGLKIFDTINKQVMFELIHFDTINKLIETNTTRQHELPPLATSHQGRVACVPKSPCSNPSSIYTSYSVKVPLSCPSNFTKT